VPQAEPHPADNADGHRIRIQPLLRTDITFHILPSLFGPLTLPLSPPACLREAASAKAGERGRVRGNFKYFWIRFIVLWIGLKIKRENEKIPICPCLIFRI
jgi:hypothetical protein